MDNYVKSVLFAILLVFLAWDIVCIIPPQGTVTIHHKASSSASFIQQESSAQPGSQTALVQPTSTHVQNGSPYSNTAVSTSTTRQPVRSTSVNNRGGTRDYVNHQSHAKNQQGGQNVPSAHTNLNTNIQSQQNFPIQPSQGYNRDNTRDYVNTHNNPNNNKNIQIHQQNPTVGSSNNRGALRDYVNPSTPASRITNIQNNTPNPTQQTTSSQASKYIAPNPSNSSNRGTIRDYVNPNIGIVSPSKPNSNTNVRNYVAPQRPAFPALPNPASSSHNPSQSGVTPTQISYANKVSGGVTTKSPLATTKSAHTGPPSGSSTTEKPDEGPTDLELRDFSEALLRRDVNNAGRYVTANLQGKTTSQSQNDEAPEKLLQIKPEAYEISTISKLKLLHNNYILNTNENEHVTAQEKAEENDLIDAMLTTPVMQYTRNFLISKGRISKDPKDFKDLLKLLWFSMYSRGGGRIGSSGFEHIFLAELKKDSEVSGLHNWVYFDQAETSHIVDYLGYMKKIDLGEKGAILKFHFKLNGIDKPVNSMFIGTSPELEVSLYTTCYLFRADKICPLRLNGNNFIVRTYSFRYRGKNMIGSAFPEI